MSRSPVGFLFAFVAGDGGIFEGAPVGFVAFQRQLLGPAGHVGGHLTWWELLKQAAPQETSAFPQDFSPGKLLATAWVIPTLPGGSAIPSLLPRGAELQFQVWTLQSQGDNLGQDGGSWEGCATKTEESMNRCKICLCSHHMKLEPLCSGSEGKQHFQGRVSHAHA